MSLLIVMLQNILWFSEKILLGLTSTTGILGTCTFTVYNILENVIFIKLYIYLLPLFMY